VNSKHARSVPVACHVSPTTRACRPRELGGKVSQSRLHRIVASPRQHGLPQGFMVSLMSRCFSRATHVYCARRSCRDPGDGPTRSPSLPAKEPNAQFAVALYQHKADISLHTPQRGARPQNILAILVIGRGSDWATGVKMWGWLAEAAKMRDRDGAHTALPSVAQQ
jgi:hypothetical protein